MLRRKIPLNHRNVTGAASASFSDAPTQFESLLEYDFFSLLRFDEPNVRSYDSQQPIIYYKDPQGKDRRYTPDVLVNYASGATVIYEVKPRSRIKRDWHALKPKFIQAIKYAKARGWRFKIVTEVEIQTEYLKSVRFLENYRNTGDYDQRYLTLIDQLTSFGTSTPDQLIASIGHSAQSKAELLYTLWQLVADHVIGIDMHSPLSMHSEIWFRLEGAPDGS